MKICEELSEIERLMLFRENIKQYIELMNNLDQNSRIITFYNLIFLTKFDKIFPLSSIEMKSNYDDELCVEEVTKSLTKEWVKNLVINFNGNDIEIEYCKKKNSFLINSIDFNYGKYKYLTLENIDNINFEVDDLSEIIEQKYQLILEKFEEIIEKDKMLKNNINFMKELIGNEV